MVAKRKKAIALKDLLCMLIFAAICLYGVYCLVRWLCPPATPSDMAQLRNAMENKESFLAKAAELGLSYNDTYQCLYGRFEPDEENVLHLAVSTSEAEESYRTETWRQTRSARPLPYTTLTFVRYKHLVLWLVNDSAQKDSSVITDAIAMLAARFGAGE